MSELSREVMWVQTESVLFDADREALRRAYRCLEYPSLAARLTGKLGAPVEKAFQSLPHAWHESLQEVLHTSLERTLNFAIHSLDQGPGRPRGTRHHKALGMLSGAAGGLFGLPSVLAELPLTTVIMLRAIADIARAQGEDLSSPEARLACMEVFALGGRSKDDDAAEAGYYSIRLALGWQLTRIPERMLGRGTIQWSRPALVRFITEIGARFGVVVTEKAALQLVPLVGAGVGGLINLIFMEHFQEIARAHFTVRRLERLHGRELIRAEYEKLTRSGAGKTPP